MSFFEKNFILKSENVLNSLDKLIAALKNLNQITEYFSKLLSGEVALDLSTAKQALIYARQDEDNELLESLAKFVHADAVRNLDEGLLSFLIQRAPGSSVESLEQAAAFYACEDELSEYVTKKGKSLLVISLHGIPLKTAKEYDPYAFIYNGHTVVRAKHLPEINENLLTDDQKLVKEVLSNATDTDAGLAQLGGLRRGSGGSAALDVEPRGTAAAPSAAGAANAEQGILGNINTGLPASHDAGLLDGGNHRDEPADGGSPAADTGHDSSRSGSRKHQRSPVKQSRDRSVIRAAHSARAALDAKELLQKQAEDVATEWGSLENIQEALPYLLPEQQGDVVKAEQRLMVDNQNGILFTNGTGTGKTFTGLGAVKRAVNAGLKNVLIVTLSDKIARDFVKSGKPLGLNIYQLKNSQDNGGQASNIVVTTFANFGSNGSLVHKQWDFIIVDESHTLSQSADGESTNALRKLRALSGHHAGFDEWASSKFADQYPKKINDQDIPAEAWSDWENLIKDHREAWKTNWKNQTGNRAKVIFLSATPFSYLKSVDWAEGYLFHYSDPSAAFENDSSQYNAGSARDKFYMEKFGFRMRYNKLTRPDGKVDSGVMERQFAESLKSSGALSGRDLVLNYDYDRKFVLIRSKAGQAIDEGLNFLSDAVDEAGRRRYQNLSALIQKRFDYLSRRRLLEAIKANEGLGFIKKNLALQRKVVIFHDYNDGGGFKPFAVNQGGFVLSDKSYSHAAEREYEQFAKERPDLVALSFDYPSPIQSLKAAFPKALLFNGRVSKQDRQKNVDLFNDDSAGFDVLIVQSDAGSTGISLHDTTGKYPRVIVNIGQPVKPAKLRQTEGRIYRVGQSSNAIQRYMTTGTGWERAAFADTIAGRAETVDNLAKGSDALVSIKEALIRAYEEADYYEPSALDGVGGKAYDEENARIAKLTPFDQALTYYYAKGKRTESRRNREGKEWYATPEPLGYKMIEWAGVHAGDEVLEPSAGDGAIGRFVPSDANLTMIEPTESLVSRAKMANTGANVIVDAFESLGTNNKYHAIVMNPPYGNAGSIAIKHVMKAFEHLYDGGRIVALIPRGAMDQKLSDWLGAKKDAYVTGTIELPQSTFKNAGTGVMTRIVLIEKHSDPHDVPREKNYNFTHAASPEELFDMVRDKGMHPRKLRIDEQLAGYQLYVRPERSSYVFNGDGLNSPAIKQAVLSFWGAEENQYGEIIMPYNKAAEIIKKIKQYENENGLKQAS
jgi:hypothetical protein